MSSGAVVARVKHLLPKGTKIGHAGTLDPEASGVLPIMIGKATRLFDYTTSKTKTYLVELVPGIETDTQDLSGAVLKKEREFTPKEVEQILPKFIGEINQIPPMYSAIKVGGQRLYALAREGKQVDIAARKVWIESIHMHGCEGSHIFLEVSCGRGTYMRTLCHDIGKALGSAACMGSLVRTRSGPFVLSESVTLETLYENGIEPFLLPMDTPLKSYPSITVDENMEKTIRNGGPFALPNEGAETSQNEPTRVYMGSTFCGIVHRNADKYYFDCMLLE